MITRILILLVLLGVCIFLTSSLPASANMKKVSAKTTDCSNPTYQYQRIGGVCMLVEYCDGVINIKYPVGDSYCP